MAYLDEEGFAKEAEAAGYSKEAIAAHIVKIRASDAAEKHDTVTRMLAPAAAASAAVAQPVVTPSAPTPAPVAAAPTLPAITGKTTPAELFNMRRPGSTVERMGGMVSEAGTAAGNTASNATQDSLDYAQNTLANDPYLPAKVLLPLGVGYGIKKAADAGLFSDLGAKIAAKFGSTTAQPQPFVGGAGPRVTPPAPAASPIQNWDIHSDPSFGNFLGDATAPAANTAPAAPVNTKLEELKAKAAAGIPATGEFVGPMQPVGPPEFTGPRRPIVPTPVVPTLAEASPAMPSRPVTPTPPTALATTTAPVTPTAAPVPPTGELRTGAGLPAYAGEGKQYQRMPKEFASVKEVPAGYAFVPGVGPGTNTIRNLETPEGYRALVQLHGGPFGSHDEAVDFMNKYNAEQRMGPPADRALRKSLGLPLQENTKGIPMKSAKVAGIAGAIMAMSDVANAFNSSVRTGNAGPLMETAFDIGISAIPGVRAAATGLTGSTLQSGKLFKEDRDYSEVLNRPGVRQVLDNMSKIMTPDQFNLEADKYLSKLSSFPQYNSSRFIKPAIGSTQPINRTTLLPIAPPAR